MSRVGEVFADAGLHVDNASFAQYATQLQATEGKISNFADSSKTMMAGIFASPALAVGGIAAVGAQFASGFQDASITLKTLYGDSDIAKEKMQWMMDFSASTPFSFDEIVEGGIKLKAYGMDIEQYGKTFGDTASGMGKSFNDVIEAVADAQTGEFERLKELGIKAIQVQKSNADDYAQYGAKVGDTVFSYVNAAGEQTAQVVDRNNREMITSTLGMIWNEKYAGAMEARSQSLSGMISTLKDNLQMGLADMAGFDLQTGEVQAASLMGVLMELAGVAIFVADGFKNMSEPMQMLVSVFALGAAGAGLVAAGLILYNTAVGLATPSTLALAASINAAIWPATAVVIGISLLAAGLVYLDQKTGIVGKTFQVLSDIWTIASYEAGKLFDYLYNGAMRYLPLVERAFYSVGKTVLSWIGISVEQIEHLINIVGTAASKLHDFASGLQSDNQQTTETNKAVTDSFSVSGIAASLAGEGYTAAGASIESTGAKATTAKSGVDALTQSLLDAATAQQNLWKAQNEIAKTNMTVASANKSIRESYGTSPNSLGTSSPDGAKIIPAKNGMTYNQQVQALLSAGVYVKPVVNVGTVNNYGKQNSQTKTKLSVLSGG